MLRAMGEVTGARHLVMSIGGDGLLGWDRAADTVTHVPAREVVILDGRELERLVDVSAEAIER